jgi:hypothetical protein
MAPLFKMATLYFRVSIRALTEWGEKLRMIVDVLLLRYAHTYGGHCLVMNMLQVEKGYIWIDLGMGTFADLSVFVESHEDDML